MRTQQNINNNNVRSISARLLLDQYFDYMLYKGDVCGINNIGDMTIADFSCPFDIQDGVLYSTTTWKDAVNDGVKMEDIGFTGPDNGFISFRKDRISNKEFLDILTGSTYSIEESDFRFFLSPVTGNTLNFDYPIFLNEDENDCSISLKGGFYQGFYKLHGFNYQTLPNGPKTEWNLSFTLRPRSDYEITDRLVNHIHPENNGIFFFMGTRAENKFWSMYKTDSGVTEELKRIPDDENYTMTEACGEEADFDIYKNNVIRDEYLHDEEPEKPEEYFEDGYTVSSSTEDCPCVAQTMAEERDKRDNYYFNDGYLSENEDDYAIGLGEKDCYGKKNPGGDVSKYCNEYSSQYQSGKCGCSTNSCSNKEFDLNISSFYDYKYNENSNCCGGCSSSSNDCKKGKCQTCCCDSDYKDTCCGDYWGDSYYDQQCGDGDKSISTEYIEKDVQIDENDISDSFGHELTKKGYYEIESDNKFLMFDRTKDGYTVNNWIEGTKVTLTGRQDWPNINYFPIMNRTCTGYTVNNIYEYNEENSIPYNIYKDIKNNAFGLRINEDGAIGYRYAALDCEAENEQHFTVFEEYSKPGMVKDGEWNNINVKISILNPLNTPCEVQNIGRKMKLYFYVNGNLVLVSKELDAFRFKELNDTYQKQEGVPYNISLGGGTQGLLESILPDYYNTPDYIFPMEKYFCGTFMGDIKSFKIIDGMVNHLTIKNYL